MLGFEDRGIMTCFIQLDYGDSSSQGFGGYSLGGEYTDKVIKGILKALDVDMWEKLKGTNVRIETDGHKIIAIGHFLKEHWFSF